MHIISLLKSAIDNFYLKHWLTTNQGTVYPMKYAYGFILFHVLFTWLLFSNSSDKLIDILYHITSTRAIISMGKCKKDVNSSALTMELHLSWLTHRYECPCASDALLKNMNKINNSPVWYGWNYLVPNCYQKATKHELCTCMIPMMSISMGAELKIPHSNPISVV